MFSLQFIKNRNIITRLYNTLLSREINTYGVPHESVLVHIICSVFINNVSNIFNNKKSK